MLLCTLGAAFGQRQPMEFAVHHTYTRSDGFLTGIAYTVMDQLGDGSVVMRPFAKDFVRLTPIGARPIFYGSTISDFLKTEMASTISGQGVFWGYPKGLMRLEGDSLQAFGNKENLVTTSVLSSGNHLLICDNAGQIEIWKFDGQNYHSVPLPYPFLNFTGLEVQILRNFPDGTFRLAAKKKDTPLYVWQYNEIANAWIESGVYDKAVPFSAYGNFGSDSLVLAKGGSAIMYYPIHTSKKPRELVPFYFHTGSHHMQAIDMGDYLILKDYLPNGHGEVRVALNELTSFIQHDKFYNSIYIGQRSNPFRIFPHVRYFDGLYASGKSGSTLTLTQAQDGTIYFGSYEGHATSLQNGKFNFIDVKRLHVMPGGKVWKNKAYTFAELSPGILKLGKKSVEGHITIEGLHGYIITFSRDSSRLYTGLGMFRGIGSIAIKDLEAGKPIWTFIDTSKGIRLNNVNTISEDNYGRLWFGRISDGWGVYYPDEDTAHTYLIREGNSSFGIIASYFDKNGTVWMGGSNGLWFVDANKREQILSTDALRLRHPLLTEDREVVSITPWGKYLLFNTRQQLLMLDLEHFYQFRNEILDGTKWPLVHHMNVQEVPVGTNTVWNQNGLLIDQQDSTLLAASSNTVYRIDLATWMKLKRPHAIPSVQLSARDDTVSLKLNQNLSLPPTSNSLSFNIFYQTTDNMPRLLQVALVAAGDTARWSEPATQTHFEAWNRQTGNYTFLVRVIEHDGTINEFTFPITIRKFLWQQWWFWLLLSMLVGGVIFYYYYLYKQKQLAKAHAARLAAEAEALKADQQRQLTAMQVKSLSTQFRPHFILNALNTIGAQLYDKPDVDKILGQLGESIGIIFKNAQSGAIAHPLATEWRLVESVIQIKQLEMRQAVQVHWHVEKALMANDTYRVPMGILQIPVENALVHGLRNKEDGSRDLWIHAKLDEVNHRLCIAITDNGIGRKAAALLTNYRSNGVGSRNLQSIVELLNPLNERPITIDIEDLPLLEQRQPCGTRITVCIPENYKYEH